MWRHNVQLVFVTRELYIPIDDEILAILESENIESNVSESMGIMETAKAKKKKKWDLRIPSKVLKEMMTRF